MPYTQEKLHHAFHLIFSVRYLNCEQPAGRRLSRFAAKGALAMARNSYMTGQAGESAAAICLRAEGCRILEHDYHYGHIDIDLIAEDQGCLIFAEVKYRRQGSCQHPLQAVDKRKQRRMSAAALQYMVQHGFGPQTNCRFDVIAFYGREPIHIKNAFEFAYSGIAY